MRALLVALQFLTRLPLPALAPPDATLRGRSVLYYPVVGLLIGVLLATLAWLLEPASVLLAAALVLLGWVLLTGGLHLDGLADSADAWIGGHGNRERTLAIMKDAASGPAGVSALVLVLLLKFAALATLLELRHWPTLLLAPVLGRVALVFLLWSTPYVRSGGIGVAQAANLPRAGAVAVLLLVASALPGLYGARGAGLLATLTVLLWALRRLMRQRIGGITGDTLGASCEIVEATVLVFMALAGGALPAWADAAGG
jgi:adenosylcobinamide-GDP ribazoletransferase